MNKNYRLAAFYLVALITCGAIFGCLIVGFAAIPNNTIRQNAGAVMPTFNATGAGYFVGPNMIVSAARAAAFVTVDTGQGANELYPMDQGVRTSDDVQFNSIDIKNLFRNTVNKTDVLAYPETESSYIFWADGANYRARDGTTGVVTSNANWETLLTSILGGGPIVIKPATYTKTTVLGIVLPSGTKITLESGVTIIFSNNVGAGATFFNITSAVDVEVSGGVLDGNKANQGVTEQIAFSLTDSTRISIGCAIRNLRGVNIDADDVSVYNWVNPDFPLGTKLPEGYDANRLMNIGWEELSDFEDATEWTGETGVDNVVFYSGTQSLYATVAPANLGVNLITTTSKYLFDPIKTYYRVKIRTDNPARISYCKLRMYMPDISNMVDERLNVGEIPANEWVTAYGSFQYQAGKPDPTNIVQFRIAFTTFTGDDPITIWLDKLEILHPIAPYGVLTFSFDGETDSLFSTIIPIMREYGLKATLFPGPTYAETDAHLEDFKRLQKDGWDLFAHSVGAKLPDQTDAENEYYRMLELNYMLKNGFYNARMCMAPLGGTIDGPSTLNALEYYYMERGVSNYDSGYHSIPPAFRVGAAEGFIVEAAGIEDPARLANYKTMIDKAVTAGSWAFMYCHHVGTGADLSAAQFRELLDYAIAKGIYITTIGDVMGMIEKGEALFQKTPVYDLFMDVLAVSAIHVRSNEDLSAATPITFTIDAQPDVPRTLSGHFDSHTQITAYTIVITGIDAQGHVVTETKTETDLWDWETRTAFAKITSIIMTTRTGTGAGDTMDIGITDILGLSKMIYEYADIYKIKKNNADQVVANAQINVVKGTYDMTVIGLAGGDDFTIWYNSNLNIIK